ncbi:Peroxidase 9 [Striga hermonthica]|uniref:peroxidase n=1 Tax=Striga hermonthica TaxID=68872 RepID=A0A9N7RRR1_STRHE|nr:Peroxidase 9 [Striga hermonthica]
MVSQDSLPNSTSPIPDQTHFPNDPFGPYPAHPFSNNGPYHHADMTHEGRLMDFLGTQNPAQRLSLSLGSGPCSQIRPFSPAHLNPGPDTLLMGDYSFSGIITNNNHHDQSCSTSYGQESSAEAIGSSRYLRSAQSLLLEMVSVGGEEIEAHNRKYAHKLSRAGRKDCIGLRPNLHPELSDSELCVCLLKLLALLEEVERRYEEYYDHMEDLVTSFEIIAGLGSGRSYTALALQAMSKHFCTLRKAIVSQIRAAKLKMDKEWPKFSSGLSGLRLLDQEGRQNRVSLQQIGLMHNSRQAWRPIRGLPETSVTILRAWLFEHFLHPYPNESQKLMLATQTGLSKNQGCDASVLLDETTNIVSEKNAGPNKNSLRGFEVIDEIKAKLEQVCPHTVSCADILSLAARDSIVLSGGPHWEVPLGRRDSRTASLSKSNTDIPAPNSTIQTLTNMFERQGLDEQDLVVLSGGHTIGMARCVTFRQRLYNQNGDITLEKNYYNGLKTMCPKIVGDNNISPLDFTSPVKFDNSYFKLLLWGKGLLSSDQVLLTGKTAELVRMFAEDEALFFHQFSSSMVKLGSIRPLVGSQGEIRKNCRRLN